MATQDMFEEEIPTSYDQPTSNFNLKSSRETSPGVTFDNEWVKSTFVIRDAGARATGMSSYEKWVHKNRYGTSASHKFASTSPGMSLGVNPKPQFTRYCDIRDKGRVDSRPNHVSVDATSHPYGLGMGGVYSEAFDDNQQRVFFRFGTPSYMFLPIWLAKAFDIDKAVLQGRGTITSTFIEAVGLVTKFFAIAAAPVLWIASAVLGVIGGSMRFYSVTPRMYLYWSTAENILNSMVARRTMLPQMYTDYTYKLRGTVGNPEKVSANFLAQLHEYIPDLVDPETGRISMFAIALRGQAAYNRIKRAELEQASTTIREAQPSEVTPNLSFAPVDSEGKRFVNKLFSLAYDTLMGLESEKAPGVSDGTATATSVIKYSPEFTDPSGNPIDISLDPNNPNDSVDKRLIENAEGGSWKQKYGEYLMAELSEGASFAVFNVESTGSVGESFSSSFGANPIESTFNAISAKARNLGSLLSGLKDIPFVGDALELAGDTGAMILSKGTHGFANPLLALAYGVNVSMPKIWESSAANLPKSNYKIKLISPYGNAYSQLFNIYLPLSMLLAASLPRNTGTSSYMSPFFCECFDKGRNIIQLGMISGLQLTRGTSNLAFTRAGHPNAIDVDLTVDNLDEIVSVDVTSNGVLTKAIKAVENILAADTPFTGYINTLTAVDVYTLAFRIPKIRLKLAESMMTIKSVTDPDPAAFAFMTVGNLPVGVFKDIIGDPASVLQSLNTY